MGQRVTALLLVASFLCNGSAIAANKGNRRGSRPRDAGGKSETPFGQGVNVPGNDGGPGFTPVTGGGDGDGGQFDERDAAFAEPQAPPTVDPDREGENLSNRPEIVAGPAPTLAYQLEQLQAAVNAVELDSPQLSDIIHRFAGYVVLGLVQPHLARPAGFMPIIWGQGTGKSSGLKRLGQAFGIPVIEIPVKEKAPGLPLDDKLKEAAKLPRHPIFRMRAIIVLEEVQNAEGPDKEKDYDAIWRAKYTEKYNATLKELRAAWESERAGRRQATLIEYSKAFGRGPGNQQQQQKQKQKGGGNQQQPLKPEGTEEEEPTLLLPPTAMPPSLEELGRIFDSQKPPDSHEVDAHKAAVLHADAERRKEEVNWQSYLTRIQLMREAFSGNGDINAEEPELPKLAEELRKLLSEYAEEILAAEDDAEPELIAARQALDKAEEALSNFKGAAVYHEAEELRDELKHLNDELDDLTAPNAPEPTAGTKPLEDDDFDEDEEEEEYQEEKHEAQAPDMGARLWHVSNRIAKIEKRLRSLPSNKECSRYQKAVEAVTNGHLTVRAIEWRPDNVALKARATLRTKLLTTKLAERLIKARPQLKDALKLGPDPKKQIMRLLLDEGFLRRRIAREPLESSELVLALLAPGKASLQADGIYVFANGNMVPWDLEVDKGFKQRSDPDARRRADDELRRSPRGLEIVEHFVHRILGRYNPETGSTDPNIASLLSRLGGLELWYPRMPFTRPQWDVLISNQLTLMSSLAGALARDQLHAGIESIEFGESVHTLIAQFGMQANSDLRLFYPRLQSVQGLLWPAIVRVILQNRTGVQAIRIEYVPAEGRFEFLVREVNEVDVDDDEDEYDDGTGDEVEDGDASAEAEVLGPPTPEEAAAVAAVAPDVAAVEPPPLLAPVRRPAPARPTELVTNWRLSLFVPYRPNALLYSSQSGVRISVEEEQLVAYREGARAFMMMLLSGRRPLSVTVQRHSVEAVPDWYNAPKRRSTPWWRYQLIDALIRLTAARAEINFESGAEHTQMKAQLGALKIGFDDFMQAFGGRSILPVKSGSAKANSQAVSVIQELTPTWFQELPVVNGVLKSCRTDDLFTLADSIVTAVLGSGDYTGIVRRFAGHILTQMKTDEAVDPETFVGFMQRGRLPHELMASLADYENAGQIPVVAEGCAAILTYPEPAAPVFQPPRSAWWPPKRWKAVQKFQKWRGR